VRRPADPVRGMVVMGASVGAAARCMDQRGQETRRLGTGLAIIRSGRRDGLGLVLGSVLRFALQVEALAIDLDRADRGAIAFAAATTATTLATMTGMGGADLRDRPLTGHSDQWHGCRRRRRCDLKLVLDLRRFRGNRGTACDRDVRRRQLRRRQSGIGRRH